MLGRWCNFNKSYSETNKKPRGAKREIFKVISLLKKSAEKFPTIDPNWGRMRYLLPCSPRVVNSKKLRLKLKRCLAQTLIDILNNLYNKRPKDGYSFILYLKLDNLWDSKIYVFEGYEKSFEEYKDDHFIQKKMPYNDDLQKLGLIIPSHVQIIKYKQSADGLDEFDEEWEEGHWTHEICFELKMDV